MIKKLSKWTIVAVVSLSLAIAPSFAGGAAFASENYSGEAGQDRIIGMTMEELQQDEELSFLLDDSLFYKYYAIDENGVISRVESQEQTIGYSQEEELSCTSNDAPVSKLGTAKIPSKYKNYKRYNCIDISYHQQKISDDNWKKIKAAGVSYAIIRVGYSSLSDGERNIDSVFSHNINGAYKAGIKVGAYYYSTALNKEEALKEAKYTVKLLSAYKTKITLPVAFDFEWDDEGRLSLKKMKSLGKTKCTEICTTYCDYINSAGYKPMVYANLTTLKSFLYHKTLQKKYKIWLAQYTYGGRATEYDGSYYMWQYSSIGSIAGIKGNVDMNYVFTGLGNKGTITTKTNYRTGPGTNYKKKGYYSKGKTVYMQSRSGDWAMLTSGYYISLRNVTYSAETTSQVNYRTGPGTDYELAGKYEKGQAITIVSVNDGWAKMDNGCWLCVKYTKMK